MKDKRPSNDLWKNAAPIFFGLIVVGGFFAVMGSLLYHEFPPSNKDFIASLGKTLENILIMVVSFWFGSNASSKAKDETISDIAKMPVSPVAPIAPVAPVLPISPIGGKEDLTKVKNLDVESVKIDADEVTITPKENI